MKGSLLFMKRGLTLTELMIVIFIFGVMVLTIAPFFTSPAKLIKPSVTLDIIDAQVNYAREISYSTKSTVRLRLENTSKNILVDIDKVTFSGAGTPAVVSEHLIEKKDLPNDVKLSSLSPVGGDIGISQPILRVKKIDFIFTGSKSCYMEVTTETSNTPIVVGSSSEGDINEKRRSEHAIYSIEINFQGVPYKSVFISPFMGIMSEKMPEFVPVTKIPKNPIKNDFVPIERRL